jgi:hypothetical protein
MPKTKSKEIDKNFAVRFSSISFVLSRFRGCLSDGSSKNSHVEKLLQKKRQKIQNRCFFVFFLASDPSTHKGGHRFFCWPLGLLPIALLLLLLSLGSTFCVQGDKNQTSRFQKNVIKSRNGLCPKNRGKQKQNRG